VTLVAGRSAHLSYDAGVRRTRVAKPLGLAAALVLLFTTGVVPASAGSTAVVLPRASTGCNAPPVSAGETQVNTTSGGTARYYIRHVPPSYDGRRPFPLVVDLHGYLEGAQVHTINSMLGRFGDDHGFVTITPQGTGSPAAHWDDALHGSDVQFIGDLLNEAERTLCIDERRVFVTGYSNGAFLASSLACVDASRIAAVAPVAGLRDPPGCKPTRTLPVVAFHGTGDEWAAFSGGLGPRALTAPADDGTNRTLGDTPAGQDVARGASIPVIVPTWAKRNHCASKPAESTVASDVTLVRYHCPNREDVELYRIAGGGHTWPGSRFSSSIGAFVGPTTTSIDADSIMWSFFEAHPLTGR
jgi:polyhydroxybutyrate depolymerase